MMDTDAIYLLGPPGHVPSGELRFALTFPPIVSLSKSIGLHDIIRSAAFFADICQQDPV